VRKNDWTTPPGGSRSPRRIAKTLLTSFIVGMLSIGMAWAGAGLIPVNGVTNENSGSQNRNWLQEAPAEGEEGAEAQAQSAGPLEALQADQVYAGSHKVNIAPRPEDYNGTWERNQAHCETLTAPHEFEPGHATDFRVRWHENSNCLYAGGFDLGPANALVNFNEEYGLWARATAISDGQDTVVVMLLDGAYYFAEYASMCNDNPAHASAYDGDGPGANQYTQDCGFRDLQNSMAAKYGYTGPDARGEHGIEPASFFLASSHAHASPDFVGAWGGVPRWYMQQVEDSMREAVYGAIDTMQPTFVEAGEILYRAGNNSRRGHYHAAEEAGYSWMRFVAEDDAEPVCTTPAPSPSPTKPKAGGNPHNTPAPAPSPTCTTPPPTRRAVATIGTYAAHPVNSAGGTAYADLSGVYAKRAEERFGGTGIYFQTGFGNMSSNGSRTALGNNLVQMLPDLGAGQQVTGNLDVKTVMRTFDQPVTNTVLAGGGMSGVFDRPMEQRPSAISISKDSLSPDAEHSPHKRCNSASPITVNSQVSVARIGSLLITGGPGELFSNYTNTIKEKNLGGVTFPLSLVNDGLGYIMQSVETDHGGRQAVGFVNGPLSEYEDAYSIDACFGDHALEQTLEGMRQLSN
jgi:hypothetical protein